jgi:5,10-methylene-tetrahydrofolate dehydrogenase/methenyl tetrahydrofolate cyclohydrolase
MILFDGTAFAAQIERRLVDEVRALRAEGKDLTIAAVLFREDAGSRLYTRLKSEAAARVSIGYELHQFSLSDPTELVAAQIRELNADSGITGIIVQKPSRATWAEYQAVVPQLPTATLSSNGNLFDKSISSRVGESTEKQSSNRVNRGEEQAQFALWWNQLTSAIALEKDVDGLHPETLAAVEQGSWKRDGRVLPATAQAVLNIVRHRFAEQSGAFGQRSGTSINTYGIPDDQKIVILGKSDIVGKPIFFELRNQNVQVEMIGSRELQQRIAEGAALRDAAVVISATGRKHLVTGEMLKEGVTVIDVGEPKADIETETVKFKAAFLTPVTGGVGPLTVVCLLENCVKLARR